MSEASKKYLHDQVIEALSKVYDPEIRRPITELNMVESVEASEDGHVRVKILLTVAGCPLQDTLERDISEAVSPIKGIKQLQVEIGAMDADQRAALTKQLRGGVAPNDNPFSRESDQTTILALTSGKGGVGKSSMTVNLACALAAAGQRVGLLDGDIYGHSIPDMMGIGDEHPTVVDDMIMPVPAHNVKVMSIGMLKEKREQVIAWRGPMLDRALAQLLTEVYWGDLDFLLVDMPPGTGDMAMSVAGQLPKSQVVVVTTPQSAAAEVAERAGTLAGMLKQPVLGVIENMSWLETVCPHCGKTHRVEVFGAGGGDAVASALTLSGQRTVPLLAQVPMDIKLRNGGDVGVPIVLSAPEEPAAQAIRSLADRLIEARQATLS